MGIVDAFNHATENIIAKLKNYYLFILFIAVVISAFMVAMQAGELIKSIMARNFELIGSKTLRVISVGIGEPDKFALTISDVDFLKNSAQKDISSIYGLSQRIGEAKVGSQSAPCIIKGVTPDYTKFFTVEMMAGDKFIDTNDVEVLRSVCVVNHNFAEKYFKKYDILGETISLKLDVGTVQKFQVVGVMKNDNFFRLNPFRDDFFSEIYIPLSVATRFFGDSGLAYIEAKVNDDSLVDSAGDSFAKLLQFKHGEGSAFVSRKHLDVIDAQNQVSNSAGLLVVVMGFISILIGFLGVQNYMNMVIKSRASEIAVRKVLGALKNDLYLQFQIETILITAIGGIGGIILGSLFGLAQYFIFGYGNIINIGSIFISILVILMLGLTGGYFPAKRSILTEIVPNTRRE